MATLVELCAGSAAVSLRWLHPKAKPPVAYQGGKRAYADRILLAMGLRPGGGRRDGRVVLVEQGPWGDAWAHWSSGGIPDTVARLRAWASEDPRMLWTRLKNAPVPTDRAERVATWAVLQFWNFGRKPVRVDGTWRTAGVNTSAIEPWNVSTHVDAPYLLPMLASGIEELTAMWRNCSFNDSDAYGGGNFGSMQPQALPAVAESLDVLDVLDVRHLDARDVKPVPGAHCYIDPPYDGTTGYGVAFPRADVIAVAERWRAAGCEVAISEAEPLPIAGWHHYELGRPIGGRRTWSKQQREWLTLSRPAVGVLDFNALRASEVNQ